MPTQAREISGLPRPFYAQFRISHVEGLFDAHTLFGYDPDSAKFVGTSLDAEGRCQFNTLEISDMEPGKMLSVGPIGKWREKRLPGDGKVITSRFSCEEMDRDRIVFAWSDRKEGGKSLPDFTLTHEREPMKDARQAFQELADFLLGGVWECDLPDLGKVEQTYQWKIKDRFMVVGQKGGDGERHCVFGLDPASRKPTWWTFKEDGTVNEMVATRVKEGLWKWDSVEHGRNGKRTTMRGTLERIDENQAAARVLECHPDPDGLTGRTEVYRRRK